MTFVFDEDVSEHLAKGMREFGEDVAHISEHFAHGTADCEWIPEVGTRGWVVVTRDKKQNHRAAEVDAYCRFGVGAFLLRGKGLNRCGMIQQVVRNWPEMKKLATTTQRPFVFCVRSNGTKIERIR